MQLRTKIAAGAAAVSAIALVAALNYSGDDVAPVRSSAVVPPEPVEIKPITADAGVVAAGRNARVDEFFAAIERDGPMAPMYRAIRTEFPQKYAEMKNTIRNEMNSPNAPADPAQRVVQITRETLDSLKDLVRQSSDESLRKVAGAQYALLSTLSSKDTAVCARYAAEGGVISMPGEPSVMQAVSNLATVQIYAAGDAAKSPQKRDAPSPATFAQLVTSMKADGITDAQVFALGDGKIGALPTDEQCKVAMSMYRSTLMLPPKEAGTLLAAIIRN